MRSWRPVDAAPAGYNLSEGLNCKSDNETTQLKLPKDCDNHEQNHGPIQLWIDNI